MSKETFAGEPLDPYALKDEITRLRAENENLREENDAWQMDGASCANEVKYLRAENKRLREAFEKAANDMRPMLRSLISRDEQLKAALNALNTGSHSSDNKAMRADLEDADAAAWRPISEAPKDGNHILVWRRKFLVMSAYWDANMQCWAHPVSRQTALIFEPTHFRPLPTPPKEPTK